MSIKLEKDNSTHYKKKISDLCLDLIDFKEMTYFVEDII